MDRAEFEQVWQRVRGEELPAKSREAVLWEWIEEAGAVLGDYSLLIERHALWAERLRQEKQRELKELRSEYFLLTGELCGGEPGRQRMQTGMLRLLRRAARGEAAAAERYQRAAESAGSREQAVYAGLATGAERRFEELKKAILRTMR